MSVFLIQCNLFDNDLAEINNLGWKYLI